MFGSRTKAAEAISAGLVLRRGTPLKPSDEVNEGEPFEILNQETSFVSGGGYKLWRGLSAFGDSVECLVFADLGASNGGFTDCLLQNGAKKVYCVDVGESQLDEKLTADSRVAVMDRTNARYLTPKDFSETLDGIVSDMSFISLKLIFPVISALLQAGKIAYVLIKPQFEIGRKGVGKSGIVPRRLHAGVLSEIYDAALASSLAPTDVVNAPVREKKNVEYVAKLVKEGTPIKKSEFLAKASTLYEERGE